MIYILPTDTCYGIACSVDDIKSYNKIYKIKKRSYDKPLAVMVPDFEWLAQNTDLTLEQITFLKNYPKPFTILTDAMPIRVWINYVNEEDGGEEFINRANYEKIAIRVAHNNIQKRLLKETGPIFLTSANFSGEKEMYSPNEIKEKFSYYLEKGTIKFIGENMGPLEKNPPSEIFEFDGDSLEQIFLRK